MKKLSFLIVAFLFVGSTAHADVWGHKNTNMKLSASAADAINFPVDPGTILSYLGVISDRLGVREGFAYDFKEKEFVNYAATTLYTIQPYGIALDLGALNADGVAGSVDYNFGALIPPGDPLTNLLQYAYAGPFLGARDIEGNWQVSYGVGAQVKFTS